MKDREIENISPVTENPHPAERSDLQFICLTNQQEVIMHSDFERRIFTDGSKIEGKVGAAISIWSDNAEVRTKKLALADYCTVYQAGLLALCRATNVATASKEKTFGIYSDSRAALQTVTNYNSLHPLAVEARQNIKQLFIQNKIISLYWIKAHARLEGNERADELAREAAFGAKRKPDYDKYPVSLVKRNLRIWLHLRSGTKGM